MPRVTHVRKAQQRYATVPVLNDDGTPKRTPVMRDGEQRVTKRGKPVFMTVTVQDKTQPLPPLECDYEGCDIDGGKILPGTPYKHITPKSGPYGGRQRSRHEAHRNWHVWEYSSSVSAQAARVQYDMHAAIDGFDLGDPDDFDTLREEIEQMAQDFLDEREEAVSNMPDALQDGSQAQEYLDYAEQWMQEISNADKPDGGTECEECSGTGEVTCDTCGGSGTVDNDVDNKVEGEPDDCEDCEGSGHKDCDECGGDGEVELSEDWVEEAKTVLREAVDSCQI